MRLSKWVFGMIIICFVVCGYAEKPNVDAQSELSTTENAASTQALEIQYLKRDIDALQKSIEKRSVFTSTEWKELDARLTDLRIQMDQSKSIVAADIQAMHSRVEQHMKIVDHRIEEHRYYNVETRESISWKWTLFLTFFSIILAIVGFGGVWGYRLISKEAELEMKTVQQAVEELKQRINQELETAQNVRKQMEEETSKAKTCIEEAKTCLDEMRQHRDASQKVLDEMVYKAQMMPELTIGEPSEKILDKTKAHRNEIKDKTPEEYHGDDWLAKGRNALFEKQYDDACLYFRKATEEYPDLAPAYFYWGRVLLHLAHDDKNNDNRIRLYKLAIKKYEKAYELAPEESNALNDWGFALGNLADVEENPDERIRLRKSAGEKYEKANTLSPQDFSILYNWGFALGDLADVEENPDERIRLRKSAGEKYEKAHALSPQDSKTLNNWGVTLIELGKILKRNGYYDEAVEKLESSIHHDPNGPLQILNLARALVLAGRNEEGIQRLKEYVAKMKEQEKLSEINDFRKDDDFIPVRDDPRFKELVKECFPK